jgi:hypothetical protein
MTEHKHDHFERVEPPVEVQISQPPVQVLSIPDGKLKEATEALQPLLGGDASPLVTGTGCKATKKGDMWCSGTDLQ